ncbi:MAG: methyltransferase domain-containing protein [Kiritimatiellae bacterium]|nr:methyltransferase domain-containing protein [Kiritimatiellia bacterium]
MSAVKEMDHVESEVLRRYGDGAQEVEVGLCCPTEYDIEYLKILPSEIIEKDYGCGDPSKYIKTGETVLDLGFGAGKICYILSQKVGASGQVIGVDFNDKMLNLARKYQDEMASKIGYANIDFRKGKIQDLALDLTQIETWLKKNPIKTVEQIQAFEAECERIRKHQPLIPDNYIDVIVSNCVLNLVRTEQKKQLFQEMARVLKPGGRAVISDIVCDQNPTEKVLNDPELWSGCISGAFREDLFLEMFADAGFYGIEILVRQEEPWHVIDGIEFRSLTVQAYKGVNETRLERNQAVIYKGPWKRVMDDKGLIYNRGTRAAVCDKTYTRMTDPEGPYAKDLFGIEPKEPLPIEDAHCFKPSRDNTLRDPKETKGNDYHETKSESGSCCGAGECC